MDKFNIARFSKKRRIIKKYLNRNDTLINTYLSQNTNCTSDILIKLYNSKKINAICFILQNESCPLEILDENKGNKHFIMFIVANGKCPANILEHIYFKSEYINYYVAWNFIKNKNSTINIIKDIIHINMYNSNLISEAIKHKTITNEFLNTFFKDNENNFFKLKFIHENKNCEYSLLKKLFKIFEKDEMIKQKIQNHPNWQLKDFN